MALTQQESDMVSRAGSLASRLLALHQEMIELDIEWAGALDYQNSITQEDLDSVPSFGGITKQQLADGTYAIKQAQIAIENSQTALVIMKSVG